MSALKSSEGILRFRTDLGAFARVALALEDGRAAVEAASSEPESGPDSANSPEEEPVAAPKRDTSKSSMSAL